MNTHAPDPTGIKLFVDTGDQQEIINRLRSGQCQGATTNPTLMREAGITDYRGYACQLLSEIPDKPISFEVFAEEFDEMERQARLIAGFGDYVYVKIPVMDIRGNDSYALIQRLAHDGVKLNVTAVFTAEQVEAVAAALAGGAPSIVSVFAGRIADTGRDPIPHMQEAQQICKQADPSIELLWASQREALNITHAIAAGCDIITATPAYLDKYFKNHNKDLRQFSQETVQMFDKDAKAAGFAL